MVTIELTKEQAEDFQEWNDEAVDAEGYHYHRVVHEPIVVSQERWATVYRVVWQRQEDSTHWGFDFELSHSESAEPWSYIEPTLKRMRAQMSTAWVLDE